MRTFVAIGDSFTEGLADDRGDGVYRGWADLVALRLARLEPKLRYANLAVRGKLIGQIAEDQLEPAAALRPDLASVAGGLNDVMRPGCDVEAVCARIEHCARVLAEASGRLVMFRTMDFTRRMPSARRFQPKADRINELVDQVAERHGAATVVRSALAGGLSAAVDQAAADREVLRRRRRAQAPRADPGTRARRSAGAES